MSRQPLVQQRARTGNLYDVVDVILDKGLVIDAFVRVSLVGIELLTVDARVVVASVDTYLHFAEAVDRLDLVGDREAKGLPELFSDTTEEVSESKTKGATKGALEGGWESLKSAFGAEEDDEEEQDQEAREGAKEEVS